MSEVRKCPDCGGDMEKGTLVTFPDLVWEVETGRKLLGFKRFRVEHLLPIHFNAVDLKAYRCSKCKLVLFYYDEKSHSSQET